MKERRSDGTLAYPGEPGSFAEEAARAVGPGAAPLGVGGFREVFAAVSAGRASHDPAASRVLAGVLPIENVLGGTVRETYDLLLEHDLLIVGEVVVPVHLCLAALPGERLEAVERVYSHVQALAQAERFLRTRPWALLTTYNTAAAGRMVAERRERGSAAVVSPRAAAAYGLEVLAAGIEDTPDDRTRFLVVAPAGGWRPAAAGWGSAAAGRGSAVAAQPMRTTLVLGLANEPGSLARALGVLAAGGLNMSKLEIAAAAGPRLAVRLLDRPRCRRWRARGRGDARPDANGGFVHEDPRGVPTGDRPRVGRRVTSDFINSGGMQGKGPADVSVIIPTRDRPTLVGRAIRSAATQEPPPREIIVVSDGPDTRVAAVVEAAGLASCRHVVLPETRGAPAARNAGIATAVGAWVALLDDDDEWLPGKLASQLAHAHAAPCREPIVSCAVEVRGAGPTYVLPRRSPDPDEPVGDWLMVRHGLLHGEGFVQTSTLFARRTLFQAVPFDESLGRLQETDWLLRAIAAGACLLPLPDVLSVWHVGRGRRRISDVGDWQGTLRWASERRDLLTPRAYAALLMSVVADMAAGGDRRGFVTILGEARRHGRPGWIDYLTYLRIWALPPVMRRSLAGVAIRSRPPRLARSSAAWVLSRRLANPPRRPPSSP